MSDISMFETRTLLEALEISYTPKTMFIDTFYKEEAFAIGGKVDIDIVRGNRKMAPVAHPTAQGAIVKKEGFTTQTITPPYLKPKCDLSPLELLNRLPGNTIYQGNTNPAQFAERKMGEFLSDLQDSIIRREEWIAAQAIINGVVNLVSDDGRVNQTIDFLRDPALTAVLAGTARWSDLANSDPQQNIRDWRRLVAQKCGRYPTIAIAGSAVIDNLRKNEKVLKELDLRRIDTGVINPSDFDNMGASYFGRLEHVDIFELGEWYEDGAGTLHPIMPDGKFILGVPNARCVRHYGQILRFDVSALVRWFPYTWKEDESGVMWLMLMSSPLPAPHEIDAFFSADVL
jgi:hypothetical protein